MSLNSVLAQETRAIQASLKKLRPHFPGKPDSEILTTLLQNGAGVCSPDTVEAFAKQKKRFSTADVMQHFSVDKYKVAASVAVLRAAGKLEPNEPKKDEHGFSRWVWMG